MAVIQRGKRRFLLPIDLKSPRFQKIPEELFDRSMLCGILQFGLMVLHSFDQCSCFTLDRVSTGMGNRL